MSSQFTEIEKLKAEINAADTSSADALEQFRIKYLGSKNVLKSLFGLIKTIPNEDKRAFGQEVNALKELASLTFENAKTSLEGAKEKEAFSDLDLTAPGDPMALGGRHPISIVQNRIISIFSRIGFTIAEDREIEDDWHNFTAMNTPADHPARDMQDTFYIANNPGHLLRTHTSSVQARVMTSQPPPIRIIAPGRVYRNETVSARAHCQFHQVEGLYIDTDVSFADMIQTIQYYAREMFGPDSKIRLRPSYFPFTEPSAEVDVYWGLKDENDHRITKGTGWLEIMGCGMVDPNVLENCDINPEKYSGYAFGMGIERQAMLQFRVNDIRQFFENDIRFLKQFSSVI